MSNANNNSDWFDGLKYAEALFKSKNYSAKALETEYFQDIRNDSSAEFCSGFLDYIDHLESRLDLKGGSKCTQ